MFLFFSIPLFFYEFLIVVLCLCEHGCFCFCFFFVKTKQEHCKTKLTNSQRLIVLLMFSFVSSTIATKSPGKTLVSYLVQLN